MKTILILLVIIPFSLQAAEKKTTQTNQADETVPGSKVPVERMNTSPNPVPDESNGFEGSLIKQKQEEEENLRTGPYDKDGNYTFPKKDTTEEIP